FIDPYGFSVFPIVYDEVSGPRTYYYAFPNRYGTVNGQPVNNAMDAIQRQRVREALDVYSYYLGVQFVEVPAGTSLADIPSADHHSRLFYIVNGEVRAIDPGIAADSVDVITGYTGIDPDTQLPATGILHKLY